MRILQVIDELNAGGAERVMVDLSNILNKYGHHVTAMTLTRPGNLQEQLGSGVVKVNLKRGWKFNLLSMLRFSRIARKHDIVHVHMRHNLKYAWLARLIFPFKSKLIFHDHFGRINIDTSFDTMLKRAMHASVYMGVSKQLCDWAVKNVMINNNKVFHLANIVRKQQGNENQRLEQDGLKLVVVSNIRKEKHLSFALEVLMALSREMEVTLDIYGQIVDHNYLLELNKIIAETGISNKINFIHHCTDIQRKLPLYDLALHTAKSETGPLVLIEYLGQSLPFVTYRTGEVVSQIDQDLPDFILDAFDVDQWVDRIKKLSQRADKDLINTVFEKYFSEENYYNQCLKIYQKSLTF
ncbi:glycosyltransferase [Fulvivirgaceae bacterium BMA10]|uniref:Glycosyltransferase n=1 Tax=Splendidivirga corallicola TaxID=3051826 RepID=A0ABT8L0P2_9BACT|nr:glycosyltransferase [Fulvivirgaceae bacterium BMA10]